MAKVETVPTCKGCGCTDDHACEVGQTMEGCHWVEPGLCSECVRRTRRVLKLFGWRFLSEARQIVEHWCAGKAGK